MQTMNRTISRQDLQAKLDGKQPPVLIEALPERYYREGHLPGALHLPHDRVRELAPSLLPDKGASIVAYCASATCQNSHIAAATLSAMGYGNVSVYAGGKQDWVEAGLALHKDGSGAVAA
jgi:rhodanese-related sulfurtransferase